jgi:hypothetical protein
MALPAAGGVVEVSSVTEPAGFSATGLDFGFATATASVVESTTYQ